MSSQEKNKNKAQDTPAKAPATALVVTPNPAFSGTRGGIVFKDGQGEASPELAREVAATYGYQIIAPAASTGGEK